MRRRVAMFFAELRSEYDEVKDLILIESKIPCIKSTPGFRSCASSSTLTPFSDCSTYGASGGES